MAQRLNDSTAQSGFTLAGLLVILTVLAVVLAFTVPTKWSEVRKRERDRQLMFVMEQYARGIQEFQRRAGGLPTSLEQLAEFNNPRVLRQLYENPLSGEVDWILVPPGAGGPGAPGQAGPNQGQPGEQQGEPGQQTGEP
ncbi:MAG: type II secretion system protein, partial [Thermoanaerobaculia bacterium]|nr:type II secretion system protein [Thermoanaerobaculia bacterium]